LREKLFQTIFSASGCQLLPQPGIPLMLHSHPVDAKVTLHMDV
jgi:hypothetical protein